MKMKAIIAAVLAASIAGSASAGTFRFPAAKRAAYKVPQVEMSFTVDMLPNCEGRWSIEHPPGFSVSYVSPRIKILRGNPGLGTYDIAIKTEECPILWYPGEISPGSTYWHKVVVY